MLGTVLLWNKEENGGIIVFKPVCPFAVGIMEESQEQMLRDY